MHAPPELSEPPGTYRPGSTSAPPVLCVAVFGPRTGRQQHALDALHASGHVVWSDGHPADPQAKVDRVIITAGPGLLSTLQTLDAHQAGMPPVLVLGPGADNEFDPAVVARSRELGARAWLDPARSPAALLHLLRMERQADPGRLKDFRRARVGLWEIDLARGYLLNASAAHLLRGASLAVLTQLCRCAGTPVSRTALAQEAYGDTSALRTRAVDATVVRLRRLIEPDPGQPRHILTVRAVGYLLNQPSLEMLE